MKKHHLATLVVLLLTTAAQAAGHFTVRNVARNAVRIQYTVGNAADSLPDWIYVKHDEVPATDIKVTLSADGQGLTISDKKGRPVFKATRHSLEGTQATLAFASPTD